MNGSCQDEGAIVNMKRMRVTCWHLCGKRVLCVVEGGEWSMRSGERASVIINVVSPRERWQKSIRAMSTIISFYNVSWLYEWEFVLDTSRQFAPKWYTHTNLFHSSHFLASPVEHVLLCTLYIYIYILLTVSNNFSKTYPRRLTFVEHEYRDLSRLSGKFIE